jgi:hypothetical protein
LVVLVLRILDTTGTRQGRLPLGDNHRSSMLLLRNATLSAADPSLLLVVGDGPQVAQLVLHNPRVILRDPAACRENVARLRLYSLRRPASWGQELEALLGPRPAAAAPGPPPVSGSAEARRQASNIRRGASGAAVDVANSGHALVDDGSFGAAGELDADVLSVLARILAAPGEVIDRFEYLVLAGERPAASIRELVYEPRVKFVRQCPRYSRWWAEGAARQRGEGGGAFGLGSGLERGWGKEAEEVVAGKLLGSKSKANDDVVGWGAVDGGDGWGEDDGEAERLLEPESEGV